MKQLGLDFAIILIWEQVEGSVQVRKVVTAPSGGVKVKLSGRNNQ